MDANILMGGFFKTNEDWDVIEQGAIFSRIYYIHGGKGSYSYGKGTFSFRKSEIYLFPSNMCYQISTDTNDTLEMLFFRVVVNPPVINDIVSIRVHKNDMEKHIIEYLINNIKDMDRQRKLYEKMLESLLILVDNKEKLSTMECEALKGTLRFISQNYMNDLDNKVLADVAGYAPNYFIRLFNSTVGITPQKYVARFRIGKAIEMMLNEENVEEISNKLGFASAKSFNKFFKKNKGMTFVQYKKKLLSLQG